MRVFNKVLVANRGEIAVRIIRTLHEMGIAAVAVYSEADRASLHVRMADEAIGIGPARARDSYLNVARIRDAIRESGADAVHPGYGFLSESLQLPEMCSELGVAFIGPPPNAIAAMGSKTEARARMEAAGVPVVPGGRASDGDEALATARELGFPVMVKAALGGGGKGMRLVEREQDLAQAFERAQSEALAAFGDDTVYLERAIIKPRHVEIQLLADQHGNCVHLFERDCSIQRRHQKVVEETPCPVASAELVAEMGQVAIRAALAVDYCSAGTVEFLLDQDGSFYFLEMNTRLQVEHPITEWITGIDLVHEMVRIAAGEPLGYTQTDVTRRGAAIECRVYAEDPERGFMPSPGTIDTLRSPSGPFVRDDGGVYSGATVSSHYDPLVSKLSVWGIDRAAAIARMRRALSEYVITGIRTNLTFHQRLLADDDFALGNYHTGTLGDRPDLLGTESPPPPRLAVALAVAVARAQRHATATASADPSGGTSAWIAAQRGRWRR